MRDLAATARLPENFRFSFVDGLEALDILSVVDLQPLGSAVAGWNPNPKYEECFASCEREERGRLVAAPRGRLCLAVFAKRAAPRAFAFEIVPVLEA